MAKATKTNVLRHLDALKIPYETREYTVDDDNFDGKLVAEKVDLPAEMIYKPSHAPPGARASTCCRRRICCR